MTLLPDSIGRSGRVSAVLLLAVLAVSCNRSGPQYNALIQQPDEQPATLTVPTASPTERRAALQKVAVRLQEQKRDIVSRRSAFKPGGLLSSQTTSAPSALKEPEQQQVAHLQPAHQAIVSDAVSVSPVAALPKPDPIIAQKGPLGRLHAKLAALENGQRTKPVTILHIGDSHVASDSFSRGIRNALQKKYGDAGRGMVLPPKAFKYGVADGVRLSSAGNWRAQTALKSRQGAFGVSGVNVMSRSSRSSLTMKLSNASFDWAEVTVLSGPSQGNFSIKVGVVTKKFDAWSKQAGSKTFRVDARGDTLEVRPGGGAQTTVLNWATGRNRAGVRYVNFGLIGATVNVTRRFDKKLLANDIRRLDPDLIVYGYGTNEGFQDGLKLSSYENYAGQFVDLMKASAPNADLAFIGPASGLRRKGNRACGGWSVPPKLGVVRDTLRNLAQTKGAAYWDWSAAMGGPCGINSWAAKGLASKDRVHLTNAGYRRSAQSFANWLVKPGASATRVAASQ